MAISAALVSGATIYSSGNRASGATYVTGTGTPSGGGTLLLACMEMDNTNASEEPDLSSVTGWGLTWEHIAGADNFFKTSANGGKTLLYAALCPGTPGSGSLTATVGTYALVGGSIVVVEVSGDFSGASTAAECIAQIDLDSGGTAASYSFASGTTTGSRSIIFHARNGTTTYTLDSDWTLIDSGNHSSPTEYSVTAVSDATDGVAALSWGGGSGSNGGFMAEVIEVASSGTTYDRSVAAAVTLATASVGEFFSVFERTVAAASTLDAQVAAFQRELIRSTATSVALGAASVGEFWTNFSAQVAADVTLAAAVAGTVTGGAVTWERSAAAGVTVDAQVAAFMRELNRAAAASVAGVIAVNAEFFSVLERSVQAAIVTGIEASGARVVATPRVILIFDDF